MSLCIPPLVREYRKQKDKRQRARRLGRLGNRGIETVNAVLLLVIAIAVGIMVYFLATYLFHRAKSSITGFGNVLVSASGDASTGVVSITIQNELNVPIDVQSITIYGNGKTLTLSNCKPSETPKVPAGNSVTIVCQVKGMVGGYTYTVVVTYKTPNGHTAAVQSSFTPT